MQRRKALKLLGAGGIAGIAGCTGPLSPIFGPGDKTRRISLTHADSLHTGDNIRMEVSVVESRVTKNHPARVQMTLSKEDRPYSIDYIGCPFHREGDWVSIPRGVLLAAMDNPPHRTKSGPLWVIDPPPESAGGDGQCTGHFDFSEGPLQVEYSVYDDGRESGYLEPGFYMFSHDFGWQSRESLGDESADRDLYMLEFGLTIEK